MIPSSLLQLFARSALGLALLCGGAASASAASISWNGSTNDNWSTAANWTGGVPNSSNDVTFTTVDSVNNNTTITSIVDSNTTISAIRFSNTSGDGSAVQQNLHINNGVTLTVNGGFIVGMNSTSNGTQVSISGDTLSVGGAFNVGGSSGGSNKGPAVLDLSGLNTLNKTGSSNLLIGSVPSSGSGVPVLAPQLILAANNTVAASLLRIGGTAIDGTNTLSLGSTSNVLNLTTFQVGGGRTNGQVNFHTSTGTLKVRGLSGAEASRANLNLLHNEGAGVAISGTMNLLGHAVDLKLDEMNVNTYGIGTTTGGTNSATFSFNQGVIDANSLLVSRLSGSSGNGVRTVNSTLNFNGGTVTINGAVTMAQNNVTANAAHNAVATMNIAGATVNVLGGGISIAGKGVGAGANTLASGTLNITAGSLTVAGDIIDGGFAGSGGAATTTLTLQGGTLDMQGHNIGGAVAIDNVNLRSGTLRNVGQINNGAAVSKTTSGTLTVEGTNTWTGATTVSAGTLLVNGSITSPVTVANNATLGGRGTITGNSTIQGGGTLSPGASPGTITFTDNLTLQTNARVFFEAGDLILVGGLLTLPASWELEVANSPYWALGKSTVIFDYGSTNAAPDSTLLISLDLSAIPLNTSGVYLYNDSARQQILLMGMHAVPEPSTALLVAGVLAVGGYSFARRRKATTRHAQP